MTDDETSDIARQDRHHAPTFAEAFRFWLKLGFISFGGPTGQIAIMQTELVEKKKWISESRFLHALNYCMLLPGPEAQQLAIYIGWLLHKTWGGVVAGAFFVIPSIFILWTLSYIYAAFGNVPLVAAIFYGLKPAVMAIVAVAVIRIGRKALKNEIMWGLAGLSFVAIFFFQVPFPVIILTAGVIGLIGGRFWKRKFDVIGSHNGMAETAVLSDAAESPEHARPSWARAIDLSYALMGEHANDGLAGSQRPRSRPPSGFAPSGCDRPGLRENLVPSLSAVQNGNSLCDPDQSVVQYGSRNGKSSVAGQGHHRFVRAEDIADEITHAQSLGPIFDNADQ